MFGVLTSEKFFLLPSVNFCGREKQTKFEESRIIVVMRFSGEVTLIFP